MRKDGVGGAWEEGEGGVIRKDRVGGTGKEEWFGCDDKWAGS